MNYGERQNYNLTFTIHGPASAGDDNITNTQTFSYKKIKVSKSLADKVAAQQWGLMNTNVIDGIPW